MKITRSNYQCQTQSFLLSIKICLVIFGVSSLIGITGCSSPLIEAVRQNDTKKVKTLISQGTDIEVIDKKTGSTPLYIACQEGHGDIVSFLLENKANVNAQANYGWTPLMTSIEHGHINIFNRLINNGASINHKNAGGGTPLYIACYHNRMAMVKALLSHKADIKATDNNGWACLHICAEIGNVDMVRLLLAANADIEAKGWGNQTPLHRSALGDHMPVFTLLLENGAKPHINQQFHGVTGQTYKMLGDYHNQRDSSELALNAYKIAVQQFLEEATACETATRVQNEQATNELVLNDFIKASTRFQAIANAHSSLVGIGFAANPLFHTVDSYETMSYAQKAGRCRIWADECQQKIKLLQN